MQKLSWGIALSFAIAGTAQAGSVGVFDAANMQKDGSLALYGWACVQGLESSIAVNVVAFGDAPGSFEILRMGEKANVAAEQPVANACQTKGNQHRFQIFLSNAEAARVRGKTIRIYPMNPVQTSDYKPIYGDKMNPYGKPVGNIDVVSYNANTGDMVVYGWSCLLGIRQNFSVLAMADSRAAPLATNDTFAPSEQGVNDICANGLATNRFSLTIPVARLKAHEGQKLGFLIVERQGSLFQDFGFSQKYTVRTLK